MHRFSFKFYLFRLEKIQSLSELRESWDFSSLEGKNYPEQVPELRSCVQNLSHDLIQLTGVIIRSIEKALGKNII